jgi:hypothetical protein
VTRPSSNAVHAATVELAHGRVPAAANGRRSYLPAQVEGSRPVSGSTGRSVPRSAVTWHGRPKVYRAQQPGSVAGLDSGPHLTLNYSSPGFA